MWQVSILTIFLIIYLNALKIQGEWPEEIKMHIIMGQILLLRQDRKKSTASSTLEALS